MNALKILTDCAQVTNDIALVGAAFADVPPALLKVGEDAFTAVRHRSPAGLIQVLADVDALRTTVAADNTAAGPMIDRLRADLSVLIADLS